MFFVILRDLPFFWPFCEAYTRTVKKIKYEKNTGKVEKQLKKTLKPKSLLHTDL